MKVKFAGVWYDYVGTKKAGALHVPGEAVPYAFLSEGRVTKNGSDELLGDEEGLLFEKSGYSKCSVCGSWLHPGEECPVCDCRPAKMTEKPQ